MVFTSQKTILQITLIRYDSNNLHIYIPHVDNDLNRVYLHEKILQMYTL